ncbi:MAG: anaerobic glycerol-3-phosphate dehydrogenase subunit C [Actinomyces sp.]|jgi:glycerol-3-phosphate dehydrogenase subunit C|uniref:Anaerobic glycerol-3-phosphate dehydrogenase subunit C n=1 Tax=Schaalia naturae TaxID=635203 RepID=A0ABW2SM80_9ACTO|nr:anaerobic glycerol-3-phosphate dehydrogenase subunit C [Actinomyces sp.]MCI1788514.1 anaerobic glycerol-3-phosphate dehydrogenase subunit C [Actinomyces sp.]
MSSETILDLDEFGLRASLDACVKCTICETQCPVARVTDLFPGPKFVGPQGERYRGGAISVDHSIDYCSSCGTCTLVCPEGVKVAEINHHARTAMKEQQGIPLRDKLISRTTLMGAVMTPVAPLANWALANKPIRKIVEGVVGVHADAPMPVAEGRSFEAWFRRHTPQPESGTRGQVIFFHGCAGEYFEVQTSIRSVEVLEHLGYEVLVPHHGCCGLALQSNGLYDDSRKYVSRLTEQLRSVNRDAPIVTSSGSCGGMLKHEAREILEMDTPELRDVSSRVFDICEFLLALHDRGELDEDFQRMDVTLPYHAPCQLKSAGMGLPAVQLMELVPGVHVVESGQPCCGIAGTYGLKKEKYEVAQAVGKPVFDFIKETNPEIAVCDTETCRWQLRKGSGAHVIHPIEVIHEAYGLRS